MEQRSTEDYHNTTGNSELYAFDRDVSYEERVKISFNSDFDFSTEKLLSENSLLKEVRCIIYL